MKYLQSGKNWFLLLFFLGLILLGLFGYGKYSYGYIRRNIFQPNPSVLFFAIPMIIPYLVIVFIQVFQNKEEDEKINAIKDANVENLLRDGMCIEVIFKKAVSEMYETTVEKNTDIELLKNELLFLEGNLYPRSDEIITIVTLEYNVRDEIYYKKVIFPYTKENTEICLKFQKSTSLYFDKNDPQNSIVDLGFLE